MAERTKWQMVAWAVAAVLLVLAAVRIAGPGGSATEAPPVRVDGAGGTDPAARGGAASSGESLYVHVAGEVRHPGLFRLAKGSRLAVALERAGGPTRHAEVAAVNLAQPLEDGQQVVVPRAGAAGVGGPMAAPSAGAPTDGAATGAAAAGAPSLSLATATLEQLDQLDGIGPTLAQRILDYRDENGGFRSVDELQEVEGIGEKRFASLKEAVRP